MYYVFILYLKSMQELRLHCLKNYLDLLDGDRVVVPLIKSCLSMTYLLNALKNKFHFKVYEVQIGWMAL